MVHGDDVTALGTDEALDAYENAISEQFEVDLRGRLGVEKGD